MNNKTKQRGVRVLALFITFVMLSSFTAAITITSPIELSEPKLNLFPGEEKEITFHVHLATNEGDSVGIELVKGSEVLTLIGPDTVAVTPGKPTKVNFNVKSPEGAKVGDSYEGELIFKSISGGTGTVGLSTSIRKVFSINIVKEPRDLEKKSNALIFILLIIAIIILALIIYYIVRRKK